MRRKHLAIAIHTIGVAIFLGFFFGSEARAFEEPDLLTIEIKATAIRDESIDQVLGPLVEYGIPVGIELGDEKLTPRREFNLDLPETNLKDFL
jgi:hypothetical protein